MRYGKLALAGTGALALFLGACSGDLGGDDEDYEADGTIEALVAMAPGGGSDRAMRVMAEALGENAEGYDLAVENKEGGGGAVGWTYLYEQEGNPDIIAKAETAIHTLPLQDGVDLPWTYDDFTPLGMFAEDSRLVVAKADSEYDSCDDLVGAGETISSGVSGTYGIDGIVLHHLNEAGMDQEQVPFGSTGEVVTGILSGDVDVAPVSITAAKENIEAGEMKGLCSFSEDRYGDEVLEDVETAKEQGIDATAVIWRGLIGPPDMPDAAVEFWEDEIKKAVETDIYKDYIADDLLIDTQLYGDEFEEYLADYDKDIQAFFG